MVGWLLGWPSQWESSKPKARSWERSGARVGSTVVLAGRLYMCHARVMLWQCPSKWGRKWNDILQNGAQWQIPRENNNELEWSRSPLFLDKPTSSINVEWVVPCFLPCLKEWTLLWTALSSVKSSINPESRHPGWFYRVDMTGKKRKTFTYIYHFLHTFTMQSWTFAATFPVFPLGPVLVRRRLAWTERATGAAVEWRSELLSWPGRTMKNRCFFQTISSCNSKDSGVILMCNLMCVIYDTIVPFSQLMWHTPIIALYCLFRTSLSQPCWGATQRHYTNIGHANLYLWLSAYVYCWVRLQYPLDSFVCLTRVCVCECERVCACVCGHIIYIYYIYIYIHIYSQNVTPTQRMHI